jgi:hypothetical protein
MVDAISDGSVECGASSNGRRHKRMHGGGEHGSSFSQEAAREHQTLRDGRRQCEGSSSSSGGGGGSGGVGEV